MRKNFLILHLDPTLSYELLRCSQNESLIWFMVIPQKPEIYSHLCHYLLTSFLYILYNNIYCWSFAIICILFHLKLNNIVLNNIIVNLCLTIDYIQMDEHETYSSLVPETRSGFQYILGKCWLGNKLDIQIVHFLRGKSCIGLQWPKNKIQTQDTKPQTSFKLHFLKL